MPTKPDKIDLEAIKQRLIGGKLAPTPLRAREAEDTKIVDEFEPLFTGVFTYRNPSAPEGFADQGIRAIQVPGMVSVESLVEAIHLIYLRGVVVASSKIYKGRVSRIRQWVATWLFSRAVIWKLGKAALKVAIKKLTVIIDAWKGAKAQMELEDVIRAAGKRTMDDWIGWRFASDKKGGVGGQQWTRVKQRVFTRKRDG